MAARTVPVSATRANNDKITGSGWNAGPVASATFVSQRPIFQDDGATTTVPSGVITASGLAPAASLVNFVDSDGGFSGSFPTRYTCQVPGWYIATGGFGWGGVSGRTQRMALIRKNGADVPGGAAEYDNLSGNIWNTGAPLVLLQLAAGDYVELYGFQNSGASNQAQAGPYAAGVLFLQWVSQ